MLRIQSRLVAIVHVALALTATTRAMADAIVVTRAMTASTIAEIFVEEETVRVELEVGPNDLPAFRGILPHEAQRELPGEPSGAAGEDAVADVFQTGLVIQANEDGWIRGKVVHLSVRRRVVRDEVTGEPLVDQPADAPRVVLARLVYPFDADRPAQITIRPPQLPGGSGAAANIGFVVYHRGLPVNDFRYLSGAATLELNWNDPWFSRFQHPNLRRQNVAPMSGYLYVEPNEVRQEFILRPKDLQSFVDLGLNGAATIPVERQEALKTRVGEFLASRNPVRIDGQTIPAALDRIHFVRRTLRQTGVIDPPEELDLVSATLGVIFVYPIDGLPQEVTMQWDLFNPLIQEVPASVSDEAGPLPATLTPEDPILRWQNFLKNPSAATLVAIAEPPAAAVVSVPVATTFCAIGIFLLLRPAWSRFQETRRAPIRMAAACVVLAVLGAATFPYARLAIASPFSRAASLSDRAAADIMTGLLHNVYRAFDRRDPSLVYDQLSRSISGYLLEQVYLDTRKSIEIENQGGLKINVDEIDVLELTAIGQNQTDRTYRCRWRVSGSVGHWGHVHQRTNERQADVTLAAVDGAWRITGMDVAQKD